MTLFVQCEVETRSDSEAEFLRVARALAAAAATEVGTLRYQWFVTQTPGRYSILEEYVDADAAEAHNRHVEPLLRELFAAVELVSASLYGTLNSYLRQWVSGREGVSVHTPL